MDAYGPHAASSIWDNVGCEMIYGTGDEKLAEQVEKRLGDATVNVVTQTGRGGCRGSILRGSTKPSIRIAGLSCSGKRTSKCRRMSNSSSGPACGRSGPRKSDGGRNGNLLPAAKPRRRSRIPELTVEIPIDDGSGQIVQPTRRRISANQMAQPLD